MPHILKLLSTLNYYLQKVCKFFICKQIINNDRFENYFKREGYKFIIFLSSYRLN
jgi:hypothetical protein